MTAGNSDFLDVASANK